MITATPAVVPAQVTCEDCSNEIKPGARASCLKCVRVSIADAEEDARDEEKEKHQPAAQAILDWSKRRHLLGQITAEVRAELELCAEDIAVGHG